VKQRVRFPSRQPAFGTHCACCNADTWNTLSIHVPVRTGGYDIAVPVCQACTDHVTEQRRLWRTSGGLIAIVVALVVGAAFARRYLVAAVVLAGVAMCFVAGFAAVRAMANRRANKLPPGHHPSFELLQLGSATALDTDNETLVDELLPLNPTASRVVPVLWRLRARRVPKAKALPKRG
jgi:hypothetical protein